MATTYTPKKFYVGQPSSTGTTVYTASATYGAIIKNILLCNVTSTDATITINFVPSGSSAGTTNRIMSTYTVPANNTVAVDLSSVLSIGDFIYATNTTSGAITAYISGVEVS